MFAVVFCRSNVEFRVCVCLLAYDAVRGHVLLLKWTVHQFGNILINHDIKPRVTVRLKIIESPVVCMEFRD